jgi:hypothetical protein
MNCWLGGLLRAWGGPSVQPVSFPCEPKTGLAGDQNHPSGPKQARWGQA